MVSALHHPWATASGIFNWIIIYLLSCFFGIINVAALYAEIDHGSELDDYSIFIYSTNSQFSFFHQSFYQRILFRRMF